MNADELMKALKEIISAYEDSSYNGFLRQELRMWRERFIPEYDEHEKSIWIWKEFMGTESIEMIRQTPEEIMKKLLLDYEKYQIELNGSRLSRQL